MGFTSGKPTHWALIVLAFIVFWPIGVVLLIRNIIITSTPAPPINQWQATGEQDIIIDIPAQNISTIEQTRVFNCQNCGANTKVAPGQVAKCDWCNSPLA